MVVSFRFDLGHPSTRKIAAAALLSSAASILIARNFLDTEKKIRHRIVADYGVGDPEFTRTMGQLLGPPLLDGNRVTMFQNGENIFPAMVAAVRSAQRSITFEN